MTRKPIIGEAFDGDQTNEAGRCYGYATELRYYRPRGFSALSRELETIAGRMERGAEREDDGQTASEIMNAADELLTEWARRKLRHDFVTFGPAPESGSVGFWIDVDSALADADLEIEAGAELPRGFSGLVVEITDHGNVTAANYSRGRRTRELFAVV